MIDYTWDYNHLTAKPGSYTFDIMYGAFGRQSFMLTVPHAESLQDALDKAVDLADKLEMPDLYLTVEDAEKYYQSISYFEKQLVFYDRVMPAREYRHQELNALIDYLKIINHMVDNLDYRHNMMNSSLFDFKDKMTYDAGRRTTDYMVMCSKHDYHTVKNYKDSVRLFYCKNNTCVIGFRYFIFNAGEAMKVKGLNFERKEVLFEFAPNSSLYAWKVRAENIEYFERTVAIWDPCCVKAIKNESLSRWNKQEPDLNYNLYDNILKYDHPEYPKRVNPRKQVWEHVVRFSRPLYETVYRPLRTNPNTKLYYLRKMFPETFEEEYLNEINSQNN